MSVVAIARDVGSAHHSVLHVLGEHLQVVWGALLALVIVVLLTPAVGGMARLLGAVDAPGGRRLNRNPVPRLGGLALFLGIFVPALAFLPFGHETRGLLLGAAVAVTIGAVDDFRGLRWFEKLGGQLIAAGIPVGFGIWVDRFTFPLLGVHRLPEWAGAPLTVLWIIAAPEGLARIRESDADVPITVASIDERLNDRGFIVPGLGDAGDRLYGTK